MAKIRFIKNIRSFKKLQFFILMNKNTHGKYTSDLLGKYLII